jgi:hypothetical protein
MKKLITIIAILTLGVGHAQEKVSYPLPKLNKLKPEYLSNYIEFNMLRIDSVMSNGVAIIYTQYNDYYFYLEGADTLTAGDYACIKMGTKMKKIYTMKNVEFIVKGEHAAAYRYLLSDMYYKKYNDQYNF